MDKETAKQKILATLKREGRVQAASFRDFMNKLGLAGYSRTVARKALGSLHYKGRAIVYRRLRDSPGWFAQLRASSSR